MKKIAFKTFCTAVLFLTFIPFVSIAATPTVSADGVLSLGSDDQPIKIGLSPKVSATYVNDQGSGGDDAQWYAIGTVHPGGTIGYGTSSDITTNYMVWAKGVAVATTLGLVPTAKAKDDSDPDSIWSDDWEKSAPTGPSATAGSDDQG